MFSVQQFCSFSINESLFGIDIKDVKEIKYDYMMTEIPHSPPSINGIVNVRGQIYIILNMRLLLNFENKKNKNSLLILLKPHLNVDPFGIEIDNHTGVLKVNNNDIEYHTQDELSQTDINKIEIVKGVCRLPNKLMTILDSHKLLDAIKW